ncbi:MAG: hypothetical protein H7282_09665 [Cytophagaceae bacterium]|nr:hypothetical protein [Cytophagaceae bacterium]
MRFLFYTLTCFILLQSIVLAQLVTTTQQEALAIQKRILLVALPEEDKYLLSEKQDHPEYIRIYKEDVVGQRNAFQAMVIKHWTFTDSMVVLPYKEAKSLMKKNPDKFAMLRYDDKSQDRIYVNTHDTIPIVAWTQANGKYYYHNASRYDFRELTVTSLVIELPKRVLQVFLPKLSPSEGDFIYAIRQMNYILTDVSKSEGRSTKDLQKERPQMAEQLKTKILLLDINEMNREEGLINILEVEKHYPYPVQLVNYNELENILKSGDTRYVIAVHCRYDFHNSTFYVSNAGDGTIYCQFIGPTFDYGNNIDKTNYLLRIHYPAINKLNLERYAMGK